MQPLWKVIWSFLKNLKIELPHDPEFHFQENSTSRSISEGDEISISKRYLYPLFTGALFSQLDCPVMGTDTENVADTHNGVFSSF